MVRSELLAAKGQMYDELKAKADRLLEDNQRLQVHWFAGVYNSCDSSVWPVLMCDA
jgi:hypothetical protein